MASKKKTVSHLVQLEISSPGAGKYPEAESCLPGQTRVLNSTGQEASSGYFLFSSVYLFSPLPRSRGSPWPPMCLAGCEFRAICM